MRGFSDLSKSLGRAATLRPDKQPTLDTDAKGDAKDESNQLTPKADRTPTAGTPSGARSADDLFAIVDVLARPPSQDISRPFDSVPDTTNVRRPSETRSFGRAKKPRRSVVSSRAPTIGGTLDGTLTPFGDAFKAFVHEPVPTTSTTNGPSSPSHSAIPSLVSNTTLEDPDEVRTAGSMLLAPPSGTTATNAPGAPAKKARTSDDITRGSQSPTPPKDGVFKGILRVFGLKHRAATNLQPAPSTEKSTTLAVEEKPNKRHSIAVPATKPANGTEEELKDKKEDLSDAIKGYKEKNSSTSSLGRGFNPIRKFTRLSLSKDSKEDISSPKSPRFPPTAAVKKVAEMPKESTAENVTAPVDEQKDETPLQPPAPVGATTDDTKGSPKYAHGVLLHPIEEDEKPEEGKSA